MAFQVPALPSFQTNIPQMPSPLDQYGKMLQLRTLAGQQQMQPLQQQEAQQDIQAKQLQIEQQQRVAASQTAMMKLVSSGELNKYVGKSDTTDGSGIDGGGAYQHLVQNGVLPEQASQWVGGFQAINKNDSEIRKNLGAATKDFIENRDKVHDQIVKDFSGVQALPSDQQPSALQKLQQSYLGNPALRGVLDKGDLQLLNAATPDHLDAIVGQMNLLQRQKDYNADQAKKASDAAKAAKDNIVAGQKVIDPKLGMSPEQAAEGKKEVAVRTAEQPLEIQTAEAKAKAEQLIKGMAEPGYAFNPQTGATQLTDKTAYLQSGGQLQGFRSVGEKDIREDTMLTNRLADVHQKIAEYEKALQKSVSSKDQGNMAALLGTQQAKLGAFGTEIPLDRINALLSKENLSGLSANARDQVVAYKNAREAMMGYKTVLSGSARGSDKSMDLLTQALPDPAITDQDYSKRSLDAFKQNLHVVGQGLPTLPGIKNPQQIESEVWGGGKNITVADPRGVIHTFPDQASADKFKKLANIQ